MTYAAAILAIICFAGALRLLGILSVAARVVDISRDTINCMHGAKMTDVEKEKIARNASFILMGGFFSIVIRSATAFGAALLPLLAFQAIGLIHLSSVTHWLATWPGVLFTSLTMMVAYFVRR